MEREKRIQEEHVVHHFGFPVILRNVEMIKIRDFWTPNINMNRLRDVVLFALVMKKGSLTGNQVHYIRGWLKETLESFGEKLGVSHSSIKKWENKGDEPTGTSQGNDFFIRTLVLQKMIEQESPVLHDFVRRLSELGSNFHEVSDMFVFKNPEDTEPFGLSYAYYSILIEKIKDASDVQTSTSFDFGTLSPESRELLYS